MRFYIQIETPVGWRYLRWGYWDSTSVFAEVRQVFEQKNTTESLAEAGFWKQRRAVTSRGRCSFDIVAGVVLSSFPTRVVAVSLDGVQVIQPYKVVGPSDVPMLR